MIYLLPEEIIIILERIETETDLKTAKEIGVSVMHKDFTQGDRNHRNFTFQGIGESDE